MTDPVDTNVLRARVNLDADDDFDFGQKVILLQRAVKAAADEVERLRSRVVELEAMVVATSTDRRRLRAVIENAPHDSLCNYRVDPIGESGSCTCWKADVL